LLYLVLILFRLKQDNNLLLPFTGTAPNRLPAPGSSLLELTETDN